MDNYLIIRINLHTGAHEPAGICDSQERAVEIVKSFNNSHERTYPYDDQNAFTKMIGGTLIDRASFYYVKPLPLWGSNA